MRVVFLNLNKNLTMLTDFYEFTMANGYYQKGVGDTVAFFFIFLRQVADKPGFWSLGGGGPRVV